MTEENRQKEMHFNHTTPHTTPHISPPAPKSGFPGYYALLALVLLTLIGCVVAMVLYIRKRSRLDELRHSLIPLYNYDPAEVQEVEEEDDLTEPLYKEGKLAFSSSYGL